MERESEVQCTSGMRVRELETGAFWHAAREGHPEAWTQDDLAYAKLRANDTPRCDVAYRETPDHYFQRRVAISEEERREFQACYEKHEKSGRAERGYFESMELSVQQQAAVDRVALSKALLDTGCLEFRRRRITPPIFARKAGRIS